RGRRLTDRAQAAGDPPGAQHSASLKAITARQRQALVRRQPMSCDDSANTSIIHGALAAKVGGNLGILPAALIALVSTPVMLGPTKGRSVQPCLSCSGWRPPRRAP